MSAEDEESHELPLCPNCFAENTPEADFCRDCGRPLSAIATIDPLRRTYSLGYWFRCAVQGRVSPFGFWGTWLVLGFTIFTSLTIGLAMLVQGGLRNMDWADTAGGALFLLVTMAQALLLARMTAGYVRARRERDEPADPAGPDVDSAE